MKFFPATGLSIGFSIAMKKIMKPEDKRIFSEDGRKNLPVSTGLENPDGKEDACSAPARGPLHTVG